MIGKNPLRVAKEHGHSVQTMWRVYSAWMEGAVDSDIEAIQSARQLPSTQREPTPQVNDSVRPVSPVSQIVHAGTRCVRIFGTRVLALFGTGLVTE
jgi:hypothetical protein